MFPKTCHKLIREEIGIGKPRPPIKRPISKQELSDEWKSRTAAHAEENSRANPLKFGTK